MITITTAKINESQEIRRLEENVWKEKNVTDKYDIANFVRFGYVFVAKEENRVVGAIIAMKTRDDKIYVSGWVVHKKYRRKGIGTQLYKALIRKTKGKKIIVFVEPNNKISLKAHKKIGFRVVRKISDPYNLGEGCRLLLRK